MEKFITLLMILNVMGQHADHDLFFMLHDVARLIRVEADRRARVNGMTRAQWALLLQLRRHPGLSQKEVADLLEVEPISVARLVDRLERNGLIERRPDPSDRRVWRLHLMPAAGPMLQRIGEQRAALAAMIGAGVPESVQQMMLDGLARMKANLLNNADGPSVGADAVKEIA
jgi:DNA-binding MarR family transcriptional regulator